MPLRRLARGLEQQLKVEWHRQHAAAPVDAFAALMSMSRSNLKSAGRLILRCTLFAVSGMVSLPDLAMTGPRNFHYWANNVRAAPLPSVMGRSCLAAESGRRVGLGLGPEEVFRATGQVFFLRRRASFLLPPSPQQHLSCFHREASHARPAPACLQHLACFQVAPASTSNQLSFVSSPTVQTNLPTSQQHRAATRCLLSSIRGSLARELSQLIDPSPSCSPPEVQVRRSHHFGPLSPSSGGARPPLQSQ
jgi:hypothetical protein